MLFFTIRTLPNWTDLKSSRSKMIGDKKFGNVSNLYMTSEEESPTQVQQRNIREAEMLTSNLGEGYISQQEILSDIGVLKELAILQESMVDYNNKNIIIHTQCPPILDFTKFVSHFHSRNGFHIASPSLPMIYANRSRIELVRQPTLTWTHRSLSKMAQSKF